MPDVVFQSLYDDPDFTSLKHALFYFGKLRIPMHWVLFSVENSASYTTLIPEDVYPQIEWLEKEGSVVIQNLEPQAGLEAFSLTEAIIEENQKLETPPCYTSSEMLPLFRFFRLNPNHPIAQEIIGTASVYFASLALQVVAKAHGFPCVDNRFLFDVFNLGLKRIFESFINSAGFDSLEIRELKQQYLAQRLLSIYLPRFEFQTFEDVLTARDRFKNEIDRFRIKIELLSSHFEGLPWDPDFDANLNKIITKEIVPEIENIRKEATFRLGKIILSVVGAGIVMSVQSLFPEIVRDWITGGTAVSLYEAIKNERQRGQKARIESAFSILLKKNEEFL